METLKKVPVQSRRIADYRVKKGHLIQTIRSNSYCVVDGYSIGGEAPKSFIKVKSNTPPQKAIKGKKGIVKANLPKSKKIKSENLEDWDLYIAKTGHKWYPIESITEHLIARIGTIIGLNMAKSRLAQINKQVRLLSKYFIDPKLGQELLHGADILSVHLSDRPFVVEVQVKKREPEFFTLDIVCDAIKTVFPKEHLKIIECYFLMLIFDCWIGVQDRHFENWGVVKDIYGKSTPTFSPIYDSARGLFWNEKEEKLLIWIKYKQIDEQIDMQIKKPMPQVGLNQGQKVNHFTLIEEILRDQIIPIKSKARTIFTEQALLNVEKMIQKEFAGILSKERIGMIIRCLQIRFLRLKNILH